MRAFPNQTLDPRSSSIVRPDYSWLLVSVFLAGHALAILNTGSGAKAVSYGFLIAAPLVAAAACMARIGRDRSAQGWAEMALALLLWSAGMASNMSLDLSQADPVSEPGLSMLFYVLYGVPLIFAAASPAAEKWYIRAVDGVLALALGALFWIHTFSVSSIDSASEEGFVAIRWLFDIENAFIAAFALLRWSACAAPARRAFFAIFATFACLYAVVAAFINHLASDVEFGTLADLAIALPFLLLVAMASRKPSPRRTAFPPRWFSLVVTAGSPLMLPGTLVVVSCTLLPRTMEAAAAGFVIAVLGYGLRNVLAQMRGIAEQDRLDQLSRMDALTGLPNRREFDATLQREWARARRSGSAIAIFVIDIDHFKQLNDGLGHLAGDQRLREVAQEISSCLTRASDFVGRYGGEEFVAILPDVTQRDAQALAEKMRKAVAARSLTTPAAPGVVTVSIGLAWTMGTAAAAEHLVALADAALYRAKQRGRNRVEMSKQRAPDAVRCPCP